MSLARYVDSHPRAPRRKKKKRSRQSDDNAHPESGFELRPSTRYDPHPLYDVQQTYECGYNDVHTRQPQPHHVSTTSFDNSYCESEPTDDQERSCYLDYSVYSHSEFEPVTSYGPPPSYDHHQNYESDYIDVYTHQPQPHDVNMSTTRFDGSHSETEQSQEQERSRYSDNIAYAQSGFESYPAIANDLHLLYNVSQAYDVNDDVQTQQPQPQPHEGYTDTVGYYQNEDSQCECCCEIDECCNDCGLDCPECTIE